MKSATVQIAAYVSRFHPARKFYFEPFGLTAKEAVNHYILVIILFHALKLGNFSEFPRICIKIVKVRNCLN